MLLPCVVFRTEGADRSIIFRPPYSVFIDDNSSLDFFPLAIPQVMVEHINCFFYSVIISESERDEISTINLEAAKSFHNVSSIVVALARF